MGETGEVGEQSSGTGTGAGAGAAVAAAADGSVLSA